MQNLSPIKLPKPTKAKRNLQKKYFEFPGIKRDVNN